MGTAPPAGPALCAPPSPAKTSPGSRRFFRGKPGGAWWGTVLSKGLAAIAALALLSACSRVTDGFLFSPDNTLSGTPGSLGLAYEEVTFPAADGTRLHGWWVPGDPGRPAVVFFHGGDGNVSDRVDILKRLHERLGVGVLAFDYRGYGLSEGRPDEAGLLEDARGARALVRARGWGKAGTVLYGRALGAAVAIASAAESAPLGLVVESAFTSARAFVRVRHPVLAPLLASRLDGRFDALAAIPRVTCPALFLHGDRDRVTPIGMGWQLFDACAAPKRFRTISGAGHDDLAFVGGEPYWGAWETFLSGLRGSEFKKGGPGADP